MALQMKPHSTIKSELGIEKGGPVHRAFQMSCYKHMERFTPMSNLESKGNLRSIVDLTDPSYIIYEVQYAYPQYIGYTTGPVRNYTTPGTGPYWDQRMWSAESVIVTREVQRVLNRGGK